RPSSGAMTDAIGLVGGGLTTGTAARELRNQGNDGPLVLFTAEPHLPYERPPPSKGYLLGNDPPDSAFVNDGGWYDAHDVEVRRGVPVESGDVSARTVRADGADLSWSSLLLATGAMPRHLALADDSGAPVHYLRSMDDSTALKEQLVEGARIC